MPAADQTFLGIAMVGTSLVFYKIPITQTPADDLAYGRYPAQPTIVQRLVPPVQNENTYKRLGMIPLEKRRIVFRCLEGMRELLDNGRATSRNRLFVVFQSWTAWAFLVISILLAIALASRTS